MTEELLTVERPTKLLRLKEVKEKMGLSHTTIYRLMGNGNFPKPIKLAEACVRWRESDLEAWLLTKAEA